MAALLRLPLYAQFEQTLDQYQIRLLRSQTTGGEGEKRKEEKKKLWKG
jgi:hypothetical protein